MSNLIDEDGNEIGQPELFDMSIYEKAIKKANENKEPELVMSVYDKTVDKVNELYNDYKAHCKGNHQFEHMDFAYGGIYFCAKQIVEAEEKT